MFIGGQMVSELSGWAYVVVCVIGVIVFVILSWDRIGDTSVDPYDGHDHDYDHDDDWPRYL